MVEGRGARGWVSKEDGHAYAIYLAHAHKSSDAQAWLPAYGLLFSPLLSGCNGSENSRIKQRGRGCVKPD